MARRTALLLAAACAFSILAVPAAEAICAEASEAEQLARADIVFEGVAQPGNADRDTLLSPAAFEVERYLKGEGPARVQVTTATSDAGDGMYMTISTGINPSAGDRWRIFATAPADGVLDTSTCHGSRRLGASAGTRAADPSSAASPDLELARSEDRSSLLPLVLTVMVLAVGTIGSRAWRRSGVLARKRIGRHRARCDKEGLVSTGSLDVVGRIYGALAGDGTDVFELLDAGIEWVTPPTLPWTVPGSGGHYVGHGQLRRYFANCLTLVEDLHVELDELVPADGRVLMVGRERGTSRATGRTFDARCAHLWVVRDGEATRLDGFIDTSTVALAFG